MLGLYHHQLTMLLHSPLQLSPEPPAPHRRSPLPQRSPADPAQALPRLSSAFAVPPRPPSDSVGTPPPFAARPRLHTPGRPQDCVENDAVEPPPVPPAPPPPP